MDRSEGTKRKSRKAAPFRARDGGKPRVAQPPQRDMAMPYDFQSSTALCRRAFSMGLGLVGRADHRGPQGNRVKRFRWGEEERRSERAPPPEAGRGIWSARRRSPPHRLPPRTPIWAACIDKCLKPLKRLDFCVGKSGFTPHLRHKQSA